MKAQLALWAWQHRRELAYLVVGLLFVVVLAVQVVISAATLLVTVPWISHATWEDLYVKVAENLTAAEDPDERKLRDLSPPLSLDPRYLVALDAVLRQQDFSGVTEESIYELAQKFVIFEPGWSATGWRSYSGTITHAGETITTVISKDWNQFVSIESIIGPVGASLSCTPMECVLSVSGEEVGAEYTVEVRITTVWPPKYDLRTFEEVMDDLGFDEDQRVMATMVSEFDPAWLVASSCPPGWKPIEDLYTWPVHGVLTSCFGPRLDPITGKPGNHHGIDIAAPVGTPVRVAAAGTVTYTGWYGAYGQLVIVRHAGGLITWYAHLHAIHVTVGDTLEQGQVLGTVGDTGYATGPHLHFEFRLHHLPVDPLPYYE